MKSRVKLKSKRWIQMINLKKGTLSRQLGIPQKEKIPIGILKQVKEKEVGQKIRVKGKSIPITLLLKRRANLAMNLKRIKN